MLETSPHRPWRFLPPLYGYVVLPRVAGLQAIYPGLFLVSDYYGVAGNDFGHPSFRMHKDVYRIAPQEWHRQATGSTDCSFVSC